MNSQLHQQNLQTLAYQGRRHELKSGGAMFQLGKGSTMAGSSASENF